MYDVISFNFFDIDHIDIMARDVLGNDISGVSIGDDTRIHLINDTQANRDVCQAIFDGVGQLSGSASPTQLTEGDPDPVITCADPNIAGDSDLGYVVLLDGERYAHGTTSVISNEATLTLVDPVAGEYEIFLYRKVGDYASGVVQITVNEV